MRMTAAERQRAYRERKRKLSNDYPKIVCACGCESLIPSINKQGKPATYAHGHNPVNTKGRTAWNKGKKMGPSPKRGIKLTTEAIAKRTTTRRAKNNGAYTSDESIKAGIAKRVYPDKPKELRIPSKPRIKRDMSGPNNPFYGKKHPPELIEQIAAKNRGPLNANWNGGASLLPYGPGFTRRFKRLIRERDNHTCQHCGKTREETGRTLEVHHIDHDKFNNDPTNLVTVCHSCNVYFSYHRDESLEAFPSRRLLL